MRYIGLLSVFVTGGLLMYAVLDFPDWGDPHSPASSHLSDHYITKAMEETEVPNLVTAVLADYRGFDTMLETAVVFVGGIAILGILSKRRRKRPLKKRLSLSKATLGDTEPDLIIRTTTRLLLPAIQLFALYVIAHGHHSPGGGFQGGVIFAASLILVALCFSLKNAMLKASERLLLAMANVGIYIYAGVGLLCLFSLGNFLDYSFLDWLYPGDAVRARYHSMLVVEIGVAFTVCSILFLIYAALSSKGTMKRGL